MASGSIQFVIADLKMARGKKGLSQRELSKKAKIPQSHISKIENGVVDLQLSSLIEIARLLDLEVMLVPQSLVLTVKALQQIRTGNDEEQVPLYRLDQEGD